MRLLVLVVTGQITEMAFSTTFPRQSGFNLIELVIVIVVAGILATVVAPIVMKPFMAYDDTSRRVALVDAAEAAMQKMARDVRDAIPNTLRTNGTVFEIMPIRDGGRYRLSDNVDDTDATALNPGAVDSQFMMMGNISVMPSAARLVVYNTGATQFYSAATIGGTGIITPPTTTVGLIDNGNEDTITLSSGFQFDPVGNGSPGKRFYLATTPVTYHCDVTSGTIRRYEGYSTAVSQPVSRTAAPLSTALSNAIVVNNVSFCGFSYVPGSNSRAALLIMELALTIEGETIKLLRQVHMGNAP